MWDERLPYKRFLLYREHAFLREPPFMDPRTAFTSMSMSPSLP